MPRGSVEEVGEAKSSKDTSSELDKGKGMRRAALVAERKKCDSAAF